MAETNRWEAYRKKQRRRRQKKMLRTGVLLGSVAVLLVLAWVITGFIEGRWAGEVVSGGSGLSAPASGASPLSQPGVAGVDNTGWGFVGPRPQGGEDMSLTEPDYHSIALAANGRIDMRYFETAVFVGDSLTEGLRYWNVIPNTNFCAYVGASPRSIYSGEALAGEDGTTEVPLDALAGYAPDNVYVMIGLNAMVGLENEEVLYYYGQMLEAMRQRLGAGTCFYIQAIAPLRPANNTGVTMERVREMNKLLAKLAWEQGVYFLDLNEALMDEEGWLRADYAAADGYHLNVPGYTAWLEYLVTHTAYNTRHSHLYLEGRAPGRPA